MVTLALLSVLAGTAGVMSGVLSLVTASINGNAGVVCVLAGTGFILAGNASIIIHTTRWFSSPKGGLLFYLITFPSKGNDRINTTRFTPICSSTLLAILALSPMLPAVPLTTPAITQTVLGLTLEFVNFCYLGLVIFVYLNIIISTV